MKGYISFASWILINFYFYFWYLDEELEVNEMAAETLKARKSAKAALRGNPAASNGHHQPQNAVGPPSDDDDF